MVARLERLSSPEALLRSPFENAARVAHLASQTRPRSVERRVEADLRLGIELLRAGENRRAIAAFELLQENIHLLEDAGLLDPTRLDGDQSPSDVSSNEDRERKIRHLLAIAYLRLGEQENCLDHHHATSCLVPIQESGRHEQTLGSEQALALYEELLEEDPDDGAARWLYNLAAMTLGRWPEEVPPQWLIPPRAFASDGTVPVFRDIAAKTGTAVVGTAGGVVMDDLDGDRRLDLMVSAWSLLEPVRFLHNRGDGTFEDRTEAAGLTGITGGLNLTHADYDNDGHPDVLVLRGAWMGPEGRHPNSLLRNRGDGTFEDVTESAGLLSFFPTQAAGWADFDRDGHVDLFLGNESTRMLHHPSELYRNQGDGTFVNVARASGLDIEVFAKGAAWGDVDNDGWPDLYVSTMGGPNRLFRNLGEARGQGWAFEDITEMAAVQEPKTGFPTWFFDLDNDGNLDLMAASYGSSFMAPIADQVAADYLGLPKVSVPSVYRNRGDGTFESVADVLGLDKSLMVMGSNFGDLDNDGYPDLYLGTGAPNFMALAPNRMFRNRGGDRFEDVTTVGGFGHIQKGHGVAFGDWDDDGDQDVYAVMGGAFSGDTFPNAFFENPGGGGRWITLRLEGTKANRAAIGARLRVRVQSPNGRRTVHTVVSTGGSFGSSSLQQEIGLGDAVAIDNVEIDWPSETGTQTYPGVPLDGIYRLREGEGQWTPEGPRVVRGPKDDHGMHAP